MAQIKNRNGVWYVGLMDRGSYKYRSTGIRVVGRTPPPEVMSIRNEIEERVAAAKFGVFHLCKMRVAKSTEEWIATSHCDNTMKCRKKALKHMLKGLLDKMVHEVTVGHAEDNAKTMAQTLTRNSCQTNVNVAKAWWSWCAKRGYCKKELNPFSSVMDVIKLPHGPARPKRSLTQEERAKILKGLSGAQLTTAMIGFYSGSRMSECLGVGIGDVDFNSNVVTITDAKSKKRVAKPLHSDLKTFLIATGEKDWPKGNCGPSGFYQAFKAAAKAAGVPEASPHWMRHTLASELLHAGVGLREAAEIVGHTAAIHASHYVHVDAKRLVEKINLVKI